MELLEASLERRVNNLEAQMGRVHATMFPEPDFDSGWIELPAHGGMALSPDAPLPIKTYDLLVKTGADTFAPVGTSPRDGPVWQRPDDPGGGTVRSVNVYSMATEPRLVRLQGWYVDVAETNGSSGKHVAH